MRVLRTLFILLATGLGPGCGYTLQTSHSPFLEREGIRKIYIAHVHNSTFKPGIETLVYNALVKTIAAHKRVTLVQTEQDADAVLEGSVGNASYQSAAGTQINAIGPPGFGPFGTYTATLGQLTQLGIPANPG
ncbi:MAG: hypothetical protein ACXWPM_09760, partial [Bdellovibrionota bacterium]